MQDLGVEIQHLREAGVVGRAVPVVAVPVVAVPVVAVPVVRVLVSVRLGSHVTTV
ncbi:hypothetical protein GCM10009678_55870 [Actinomadura kijaniata]